MGFYQDLHDELPPAATLLKMLFVLLALAGSLIAFLLVSP